MLEVISDFGIEPVTVSFYGSQYLVYTDGKVFSKNKNKYLNVQDNGKGYLAVSLFQNTTGKAIKHYLHRLVAICYINNPLNLSDVNHKDFNKSNNSVSNLEWTSRQENMNHAWGGDRFTALQAANKNFREAWLGEICGNRQIVEVTDEVSPSFNYYVIVKCLLCGNDSIKMAQNDFKKNRAKCCKQCKTKSPN
jgi:hypothetical protein